VLAERVLEADSRLAAAAAHAAELGTPLSDEGLLACFVAQAMSGDAQATAGDYVCTLPAAQDSALTMGERERALLPRCYARATETLREVAVKEHASCAAALEGIGQPAPPLELFLRARAHVRARSVGFSAAECKSYRLQPPSPLLRRDAQGTRRALMPFYDLINHRCGSRTLLVRTEQGAWRLHAGCAYKRNDQLFVSYGERDNLRWLLHYGFALADNPEQRVAFDVIDLVDGLVAALPRVFGPVKEELLEKLLAQEAERRLHSLALFAFDARLGTKGLGAMLEALQTELVVMEAMVPQLGGTEEEAAGLPAAALDAMLRARLVEIELRLAEVDRGEARRAMQRGEMLGHVVTLLDAEHAVVQRVLVERDAVAVADADAPEAQGLGL